MVNVRTEIHMTSFVSCELYLSFQLEICFLHSTLFFGSNLIVLPKNAKTFCFFHCPAGEDQPAISLSSTFGAPMRWQYGGYYWPSGTETEFQWRTISFTT